jgi:hypothetical protein
MTILKRIFPGTKAKVRIVERDITQIKAEDWRTNEALVSQARELLRQPVMRQMLDVVRNSNPNLGMLPDNAVPELRQHWQSKGEGYCLAIHMLESLSIPIEQPEQLTATFEPEEVR